MGSATKIAANTWRILCHTGIRTKTKYRDFIMRLKFITITALLVTISGCANNSALEENIARLNQKVDNLTEQVNSLSSQTQAISSEVTELGAAQDKTNEAVSETKAAVDSANERIDNMVASFKK